MIRALSVAAMFALAAALSPTLAQNDGVKGKQQSQSPQTQTRQPQAQQQPRGQAESFQFVTAQGRQDWSAEALIGREVKNPQGEDLGDINNVIIDEQGRVKAVTIGVGGFLGIGEKDVGVPFSALEFKQEVTARDRAAMASADRPAAVPPAGQAGRDVPPARDRQDIAAAPDRRTVGQRQMDQVDRYDNEHKNIVIVLNATKEQLKAAPKFVWLEDQKDNVQRDQARQPQREPANQQRPRQ